ncbi:MAG: hypothetical protein NVSMB4_02290 [Acidimicrobiales bacterium]
MRDDGRPSPVPPWRKPPAWWLCMKCRVPAENIHSITGLTAFSCDKHWQEVVDRLMEGLPLDGLNGWSTVRRGWRDWAGTMIYTATRRPGHWRKIERDTAVAKELWGDSLGAPHPAR